MSRFLQCLLQNSNLRYLVNSLLKIPAFGQHIEAALKTFWQQLTHPLQLGAFGLDAVERTVVPTVEQLLSNWDELLSPLNVTLEVSTYINTEVSSLSYQGQTFCGKCLLLGRPTFMGYGGKILGAEFMSLLYLLHTLQKDQPDMSSSKHLWVSNFSPQIQKKNTLIFIECRFSSLKLRVFLYNNLLLREVTLKIIKCISITMTSNIRTNKLAKNMSLFFFSYIYIYIYLSLFLPMTGNNVAVKCFK
jgi:hypothetical protein